MVIYLVSVDLLLAAASVYVYSLSQLCAIAVPVIDKPVHCHVFVVCLEQNGEIFHSCPVKKNEEGIGICERRKCEARQWTMDTSAESKMCICGFFVKM